METVYNILIIGLAGLITYWWANQGLFSALLHLLCVIAAGAIALSFWELATIKLTLRGGFQEYAWGVTLIGLFVVSLVVLRIAMDRLVPANVDLPHWANLVFGGIFGACAGILTMGIFLLGSGMLQSDREIFGFQGVSRERGGRIVELDRFWFPMHQWTNRFYEMLSVGSFRSGQPLKQYYPSLWQQSQSLARDTYESKGRLVGKTAILPDTFQIKKVWKTPNGYALQLSFQASAMDFGTMLTISKSQLQLIGDVRGTTRRAPVSFPSGWTQATTGGGAPTPFLFDDNSHYITSVPGQQSAEAIVEFPAQQLEGTTPRFLLIKGIRVPLPPPNSWEVASSDMIGASLGASAASTTVDTSASPIPESDLVISNILPVQIGTNTMSTTMNRTDDNFITDGRLTVPKGGGRAPRNLRIKGIHELPDTVVVQLNVSRKKVCEIDKVRERAGAGATPVLVDSAGGTYMPIGYILERADDVEIVLTPTSPINAISSLPPLPSSGTQVLKLIFRPTSGVTIAGFKVGDITLGTANVEVKSRG